MKQLVSLGTVAVLGLHLAVPPAYAASDAPRVVKLGAPLTPARSALLITTEVLALATGGVVSVALGSIWIEENFLTTGRPDPRIFAANVALALAVNMALTWALMPDLAKFTDDREGTVDVAFVRSQTIRRTWWIALAAGIFAGVLGAGSVVEKNDFGRGQFTMAVGAAGAATALLAFDLVALFTVRNATNASRRQSEVAP